MTPQGGHYRPIAVEEIEVGNLGNLSKVAKLGSSPHLRSAGLLPAFYHLHPFPHALRGQEVEGELPVPVELLGNWEVSR